VFAKKTTMAKYKNIQIAGGDTSAPLNLAKRLKLMEPYIKKGSDRLLDCGSGGGEYVYALHSAFDIDSYGVEYALEKIKQTLPEPAERIRVLCGDIESLPFDDETFDVVLINEVLEHVPSETASLSEIYRVLKKEGTLVVFSPNRLYPFETHGVQLMRNLRMLPIYTPFIPYIPLNIGNKFLNYVARNYWPKELESIVSQNGFDVIHHDYVWQTFENISGSQPSLIKRLNTLLRAIANILEKTFFLRRFGLSQLVVATKEKSVSRDK
jgi:ubiquinone/menaquinone biosynthesis C-methylase UbiE